MNREELERFHNELEDLLNDLARQSRLTGGWGRKRWNHEVKSQLVRLGVDRGYQTCASGVPIGSGNTWGEWLYDVVWLQADPGFLVRAVQMVAEIEWGKRWEVWEDYQKLHIARADIRVLVCDHYPGLIDECLQQLTDTNSQDCYLFASYQKEEFAVQSFFPPIGG